ncbi:hypothetical protein FN846DRAFT_785850 [Sphaerosporella brunnea]|uniref:PhoD-like phosphatase domain-containing protein n=1 Tax=Sphaerosporella brunnea TaxID=1250544 RepID=A0A5J5EHE1_9PEZI|nr:hypothetical protein FN846DRAFT_785850 [Sphaerosporella brunnea]
MRAIAPRPVPDPKLYTPNLAVKCGPLLRYTGLRRGDAPAHSSSGGRETWRGSVMIVTTDNASDYSPPPHLRLFYVNPETGKGGKDARGSSRMHGMLGQAKEIQGVRLHAQFEVTFWRFNLEVDLTDSESKIAYQINRGPVIYFWVPAKGQTMNIMFHSCNGFSLSVNPDDFCGPDPMWQDVLNKHKERPFHVMLGGGDQIYNDAVTKQTVHFREWINIKTPFQKSAHEFTGEMSQELEEFYLERYSMWFAQGMFGVANAQIPMVNIWDVDHDIIDGFGSYPNHFNRCPVFTGLGAVAFKYYMLFQHQSTVREKEEHEPSWLLGSAPGPYITELSRSTFMFLGRSVAFLGLDCRTERMRDLVLSGSTYEKVFARLRKEIVPGETKHLIVLLGIPIAYPRLVWLENLLTSRIMDPIKALGRMGIIGGFLNNFDGGVELLDDLDDHWTAKNHKQERNFFIKRLQQFAADTSIRITILGGDVHLAGIGQFFSNPKLKIPKDKDHRYMPNVISSAIVNTPPPNTMADILNKRNKIHHLDDNTDEDMYPIFLTDVDGTPRNNKRLLPRRNYCIIRIYDPARPIDGFEEKQAKQSTFSKIKKTMSKKKTDDMPPALPEHPLEAGLDGAAGSTMELDPHEYMRDGLQITLQMEINQHDPAGRTKPYSFNVPSLRKD